jgi:hypothetical protein
MSVSQKIKWRRALNEYKFVSEESEFIKNLILAISPEFQEHYERFLRERDVNLNQLNQEHKEQIKEAYGIEEEECNGHVPIIEAGETDLMISSQPVKKTDEVQMTEDEIAIHNSFSKLFKNIAVKIHPDKIDPLKHDYHQRRKMETDFKRSNQALNDREYFILIEIAEELKITLPKNYAQQTRWMKSEIKSLKDKISHQKTTYNYWFSEAESEEEKDNIIRKFVLQLFGIQL